MTLPSDELKELLANATPGEWKWDAERHEINSNYGDVAIILDEDYGNLYFPKGCGDDVTGNERNEANALLIALAPQLAAEVIKLREEVERLKEICAAPFRAMELFWEADEAADDARDLGRDDDADRYKKMANDRWQSIPGLVEAARADLNET